MTLGMVGILVNIYKRAKRDFSPKVMISVDGLPNQALTL